MKIALIDVDGHNFPNIPLMKLSAWHKSTIVPKFKMFKELSGWHFNKLIVYVLTNFNTTIEQDLDRIYTLRDLGYLPYVMVYNKQFTSSKDEIRRLQRYVNNRALFRSVRDFYDLR